MKKLFLIPLALSLAIGIIPKPVSATGDPQNTSPYDVLIKIPCNIKDEDIGFQPPADVPQFKVQCEYGKDAFYEHFEGTGDPEQDLQKATEIAKSLNLTKMFYGDYSGSRFCNPRFFRGCLQRIPGGFASDISSNSGGYAYVYSGFLSIKPDLTRSECNTYQVYSLDVSHYGVEGSDEE